MAQAPINTVLIEETLDQVKQLSTLPGMTLKIVGLVEDPDSTANDLHAVVASDPVLGTRILKVVNSAFYGLSGEVSTLQRAIVLLGLNAVKNIAIAASLSKLFRGGKLSKDFDAKQLWNHAVVTASAGRLISKKTQLHQDEEAFLAGLIHNVGILVEMQIHRELLVRAVTDVNQKQHPSLRLAERQHIGADHQAFGEALCRRWKFPEPLQLACGRHHDEDIWQNEAGRIAAVTHVADVLASCLLKERTCGAESYELNPDLMDTLKLTESCVDELMSELPQAREEATALFADAA